jgi:hypothetical protein
VNTPLLDQHLGFSQGIKEFSIEQFISKLPVE